MVTSVTKGGTGSKKRLSKHTDMTIHWKALEEHFLMLSNGTISHSIHPISGEVAFSEFFSKNLLVLELSKSRVGNS
jgi:hypothetical protein